MKLKKNSIFPTIALVMGLYSSQAIAKVCIITDPNCNNPLNFERSCEKTCTAPEILDNPNSADCTCRCPDDYKWDASNCTNANGTLGVSSCKGKSNYCMHKTCNEIDAGAVESIPTGTSCDPATEYSLPDGTTQTCYNNCKLKTCSELSGGTYPIEDGNQDSGNNANCSANYYSIATGGGNTEPSKTCWNCTIKECEEMGWMDLSEKPDKTTCTSQTIAYNGATKSCVSDCQLMPPAPTSCEEWAFNEFYKNGTTTEKEYFKGMYFCASPHCSYLWRGDEMLDGDTLKSPSSRTIRKIANPFISLTKYNFGPAVIAGKEGIVVNEKTSPLCSEYASQHPTIYVDAASTQNVANIEGMDVEFTTTASLDDGYLNYIDGSLKRYDLNSLKNGKPQRSSVNATGIYLYDVTINNLVWDNISEEVDPEGVRIWKADGPIQRPNLICSNDGANKCSFDIFNRGTTSKSLHTTNDCMEKNPYTCNTIRASKSTININELDERNAGIDHSNTILGRIDIEDSTVNANSGLIWVYELTLRNSTVNVVNDNPGKPTYFQSTLTRYLGNNTVNIKSTQASNAHFPASGIKSLAAGSQITFNLVATAGKAWLGVSKPVNLCYDNSMTTSLTVNGNSFPTGSAESCDENVKDSTYWHW